MGAGPRRLIARLSEALGGPVRARVIVLLALVLALNSADSGTIGAVGAPLEADLGISHAQLGLFATVSSGVGAVAAPIAGVLADRTARVRLLATAIAVWGISMVVGGLAPDYLWLLLSRITLGAAVAASGPIVASLIGDLFPAGERAKIYGWVLTGELVGAGLALLIGGDIAAWLSWRAPFLGLAVLSLGLAAALWRLMPEPSRTGTSRLPPAAGLHRRQAHGHEQTPEHGQKHTPDDERRLARDHDPEQPADHDREQTPDHDREQPPDPSRGQAADHDRRLTRDHDREQPADHDRERTPDSSREHTASLGRERAPGHGPGRAVGQREPDRDLEQEADRGREAVLDGGVSPDPDRVLRDDANAMTFWQAARFVLRIRTVRTLIIATAVGYFFFAGLRTFALIFALDRYGLSQGLVSLVIIPIGLGAVAGTLFGGRLTDLALRRRHTRARVTVPAVAYSAAALFFLPGLIVADIWVSIAFFTLGACCLAAANPPLGAARLDIVPASLWGRAESVRTVLQLAAEAAGPIAFGFVADELGGAAGRGGGLRAAFLIMLVPLLLNGLLLLRARRTYRTDVATAAAARPATTEATMPR
ncbi:MFS transporter [Asanoa sp. NPDC049518]|uniref:MFS transporter n=1 Tax=unclassified Asanoa TaxID=2685164 RepID=UPI003439312C